MCFCSSESSLILGTVAVDRGDLLFLAWLLLTLTDMYVETIYLCVCVCLCSCASGAPSCDSSPASVHSADSASAALLPLEDKCKKCVRYRSVPLVVNSRAREVPVSETDNTMEVYGSWQDFAPQSGRSVDSHSMSSFEMESTLLDAMRDASLGDDINSLGGDITGAESNPDLSSVATVPVGLGGLSGMSPNRPVLADIDDDMTENLQF